MPESSPDWVGCTNIRILEKDNNRRGDLFGRLMADIFIALGYERPHLNVHKSGRELDLSAQHRLEPRRAIGECKATADPIGGDDLNKFAGALDADESEDQRPVTGYFVSLAGFRETALEQEKKRRKKIVTLTGPQVVDELVQGRILIPKDRATEIAGRTCTGPAYLALDPDGELLAHDRGWVWAIYYTHGKTRTHVALIHSDGTPLSRTLAADVVAADRNCGGELHKLQCLNPGPLPGSDDDPRVADALAAYKQYLANECGGIQLDGLPADSDVGSRRLRLEHLFVPLHFDMTRGDKKDRQPAGAVLSNHSRLALLAAPGAGKSTLLKRLAVAYADPDRRRQIADDLPARDWLPLFFRCRELRGLARGSFLELIDALSQREPVRRHSAIFCAHVDRALRAGNVLLLVDGLDEISDPGDRAAFVCTLRTALQAYPEIAMVVTAREAGYRHVAAHLAPLCTQATLSPFDDDDIRRLSVAWHREVVGDTEKVRADAGQLAAAISCNDRIKRLASNPLLLTTLLLVKRWVGSLPTRRTVLYGKAVEVLLMTWNTEGHEPIPEEEALPQLCYVASAMMLSGVLKISRPRLAELLQEAREAMPTELGYVKGTVDQFIHRIEDRSSLLTMTGVEVEDGRLVEFFEFRHLTFQEFLTARAMVEGRHPGRKETDTLVDVLEPHFEEEAWREVIPLAAVLGGKATEALIQRLTEKVAATGFARLGPKSSPVSILLSCLADEAAARPETVRAAIIAVLRFGTQLYAEPFTPMLARGRYGADFREQAGKAFLSATDDHANPWIALGLMVLWQTLKNEDKNLLVETLNQFLAMLNGVQQLTRCEGASGLWTLLCTYGFYPAEAQRAEYEDSLRRSGQALIPMIANGPVECLAALWALSALGKYATATVPEETDILERLCGIWKDCPVRSVRDAALETIASRRLVPREHWGGNISFTRQEFDSLFKLFPTGRTAALILAWYSRTLTDAELAERIRESLAETTSLYDDSLREILLSLG